MLIYSYACRTCRHEFDALVAMNNESVACPSCESLDTKLNPVCRTTIRTSRHRRGRVLDMSSGGCPCGCGKKRA